ncbi:MAG: acetyl-CoA carboxylase carboxyltransferase subunit beta [Verrucomicrobia bacterium]|nr:acetyl-CoA carboxylase carboxyltransferase subunit beta [Verrucomicrobiota bacterium]
MSTTHLTKKTLMLDDAEVSIEPAVTPPPQTLNALPKKPKMGSSRSRKKEIPEGLWTKCPKCESMIYDKELDAALKVCAKCGHHFLIGARERINALVETCSFQEMDAQMTAVDALKFTGVSSYTSKLAAYWKSTSLKDAVITGVGSIGTHKAAIGVMDFSFLGGSMGAVVGEKLTRLIETGTDRGLPVIIISTSGGARMYEGMFSLMQMAKTCGALAYHAKNKLPFISILTNPTYAGVMASFASVGDLILAEPGALIGFAGPRVIKDTTQAELPPGFQTAEFLVDHGLVDAIVPRGEMKERLKFYLDFLSEGMKQMAAMG